MKISNTAERLNEIMTEQSLRQVDILNKCIPYCKKYNIKLGRNDISQYVCGKVEPGQAKLSILSMALGVNEAWLMGYDVPKARGPIIVNHHNIDDTTLYAIQVLAQKCGYHFDIFANQYQITSENFIIKLSPKEVMDLAQSSVEQIHYIIQNIIDNKLNDNILPIRSDRELNAAHARTDIDVPEGTDTSDDDIMDDENF